MRCRLSKGRLVRGSWGAHRRQELGAACAIEVCSHLHTPNWPQQLATAGWQTTGDEHPSYAMPQAAGGIVGGIVGGIGGGIAGPSVGPFVTLTRYESIQSRIPCLPSHAANSDQVIRPVLLASASFTA